MKIQKPKNISGLSPFEKAHMPFVEIPYTPMKGQIFELITRVGEIIHVMNEEHFIEKIELYNGEIFLDKIDLGPAVFPEYIFNVSFTKNTNLKIVARCNLHGAWEKAIDIKFN